MRTNIEHESMEQMINVLEKLFEFVSAALQRNLNDEPHPYDEFKVHMIFTFCEFQYIKHRPINFSIGMEIEMYSDVVTKNNIKLDNLELKDQLGL